MSEIISITNVEPLDGFWIRASFSDGAVKEIDLSELISRGSVFAPIRDHREVFNQVHVNPETHTIEWPGEVDLDPEVLYGRFLSRHPERASSAERVKPEAVRRAESCLTGRAQSEELGSVRWSPGQISGQSFKDVSR